MVYQLIYASIASASFNREDLSDILAKAQHNNQRDNLTGILVFAGTSFLQVLEGERETVLRRFKIIEKDYRHEWVFKLREATIRKRNFENWSMGLYDSQPGENIYDAISIFNSKRDVLSQTKDCSEALLSSLDSFADLHFSKAA